MTSYGVRHNIARPGNWKIPKPTLRLCNPLDVKLSALLRRETDWYPACIHNVVIFDYYLWNEFAYLHVIFNTSAKKGDNSIIICFSGESNCHNLYRIWFCIAHWSNKFSKDCRRFWQIPGSYFYCWISQYNYRFYFGYLS